MQIILNTAEIVDIVKKAVKVTGYTLTQATLEIRACQSEWTGYKVELVVSFSPEKPVV